MRGDAGCAARARAVVARDAARAPMKAKAKPKAKAKAKAKAKTKTKTKTSAKSKVKAKAKTKTSAKAKAKATTKGALDVKGLATIEGLPEPRRASMVRAVLRAADGVVDDAIKEVRAAPTGSSDRERAIGIE